MMTITCSEVTSKIPIVRFPQLTTKLRSQRGGKEDINGEELEVTIDEELDMLVKCEHLSDKEKNFSDPETEDVFRSEDNYFLYKDVLTRWTQ
ncbi:hypothetical protein NPIL_104571 [Nephila pilipes]|uniref:Uncharacterized protein n=1 Tax=Nephila pilipes TaxID=299642 RepID=A0A8X6P8J9_NEPPI|nr:hypothetical protein NPIL_104571 [Nephila pilipes]